MYKRQYLKSVESPYERQYHEKMRRIIGKDYDYVEYNDSRTGEPYQSADTTHKDLGALVGLTGTAVVILDIVIIIADDAAHLIVVLALIGAFHALEIRHVRAPGVEAGTGAVDARCV